MDGILAIWKPAGWTSHDVVAKTRRLLRTKRIGHAGTLDPQVTGVLPLCIGKSTRAVEYMQELPKSYRAVLELGIATDTEDLSGAIISQLEEVRLEMDSLLAALQSFLGEIEQTPPMYSALKVDGKRLYELARAGQTVERKPRKAFIYELNLVHAELERPRPRIAFDVTCSKGTYIRTLCVDIGKRLGVPAVMAELIRTASAGLTASDCLTLEQVEQLAQADEIAARLLPPDEALRHLPAYTLEEMADARRALQGQRLSVNAARIAPTDGELLRLYAPNGLFLGIFRRTAFALQAVKVFAEPMQLDETS